MITNSGTASNITLRGTNFLKIKSSNVDLITGDSILTSQKINHGYWHNMIIDLSGMNNFNGEKKFDIYYLVRGAAYDGSFIWLDSELSESCAFCVWKKILTINANEVKSIELNSRLASTSGLGAISSIQHNPENLPFGLSKNYNSELINHTRVYIHITEHDTFFPTDQTSIINNYGLGQWFGMYPSLTGPVWHSVTHTSAGKIFGDFPPTNLQISKTNIGGNTKVNITWEIDNNVDSEGRAYYISLLLFKNNIFIKYITKSVLVSKLSYIWDVQNNLNGTFKIKMEGGHVFGHAGRIDNLPIGESDSIQGTLIDSAGKIYTRIFTDTQSNSIITPITTTFTPTDTTPIYSYCTVHGFEMGSLYNPISVQSNIVNINVTVLYGVFRFSKLYIPNTGYRHLSVLTVGKIYVFDQSDDSNTGLSLGFSNTIYYGTQVQKIAYKTEYSGTAGEDGATVTFTPTEETIVYIYCGCPDQWSTLPPINVQSDEEETVNIQVTVNGNNKYVFKNDENNTPIFTVGKIYVFNQNDSTNINHPLRFSQTDGIQTPYNTVGHSNTFVGTQLPLKETQEFTINTIPIKIPSENRLKGFTTKINTQPITFRIENKLKNVPKRNLLRGYTR